MITRAYICRPEHLTRDDRYFKGRLGRVIDCSDDVAVISVADLDFLRECRNMVEVGIQEVKPKALQRWFTRFHDIYGKAFKAEEL